MLPFKQAEKDKAAQIRAPVDHRSIRILEIFGIPLALGLGAGIRILMFMWSSGPLVISVFFWCPFRRAGQCEWVTDLLVDG